MDKETLMKNIENIVETGNISMEQKETLREFIIESGLNGVAAEDQKEGFTIILDVIDIRRLSIIYNIINTKV